MTISAKYHDFVFYNNCTVTISRCWHFPFNRT
jgi:hypothetical protein